MDQIERYRTSMQACLAKAQEARMAEIRAVWLTIADSYLCLMEVTGTSLSDPIVLRVRADSDSKG